MFNQNLTGWEQLQLLSADEPFPSISSTPTPTYTPTQTPKPTATATAGVTAMPPTTGAVRGVVCNDLNGDANGGRGEPGHFGVKIHRRGGTAFFGDVVTEIKGAYSIGPRAPGACDLAQVVMAEPLTTSPDQVSVIVDAGAETVVNFGDWAGEGIRIHVLRKRGAAE